MTLSTRRKIENYLYNYNYIDTKIDSIISTKSTEEYNQSYTKYIKNKSSSLEDQVIRNIGLEQRILKIRKWQKLIKNILKEYEQTNNLKYSFIILKYFDRENPIIIENRLNLGFQEQKDIQAEILHYIFLVAIQNNMLVKEVNF
ncbi:MAG: hypothetical protein J6I85_08620 [Clostridia bacterium]|nr:hypothetical protein [Clostridia bacterium]